RKRIAGINKAAQYGRKVFALRVKYGGMEQAYGSFICRPCIPAVPGIKPYMVMVAPCRNKSSIGPIHSGDFKAKQPAVKIEGPLQVRDFKVNVAYCCFCGYCIRFHSEIFY